MPQNTDICQICLRTDRKLKVINIRLTEFHDELCDFSIQSVDPLYCTECEHLLKKLYKFKAKCVMAFKILHKWRKAKRSEKKPLRLLHKLLPATSLGRCSLGNVTTYSYNCKDFPGSLSSINMLQISSEASVNVLSSQSHLVISPVEAIVDDTGRFLNVSNQEFHEHPNANEPIKLEIECEGDIKSLNLEDLLLKTEETANTFEEIILKNDDSFLNAEEIGDIKQNEDLHVLDEFNSDSDSDKDKDKRKKNDKQNNVYRKKVKCKKRTVSFTDLDDIPLSHDFDVKKSVPKEKSNDSKMRRNRTKKKGDQQQRRVTRKRLIDKDKKKERFHTKKDILAELSKVVDSDAADENFKKMKGGKPAFSKERLKEELLAKFESCGELTTDDGVVVDKQFILSCLEDKVTEFVMRQLWNAVHGKSTLKPKALKLFKCIQNKYKNEYESVFDIEYLNTKEKMLEEFQRRKTYACYTTAEFKCEMCFQGFKHEKKLEYHKKCHDESAGEFICSICSVRQKHKKNLISHVNSHEAVYKCKLCPLVTYYKCSMVNHYHLHKGVKFRCEPCDTTFGSQSAYRTHVSYRHQRQHVCTTCGRAFFTEIGLKWHGTRAHQEQAPTSEGSAPAQCPQCPLSFPTQEACARHGRITHEPTARGRPPSTSHRCTALASRCGSVGSSIGWLNLHFRTDHPAVDMALLYADKHTHLCHVCGKGFTTIYTLRAHEAAHSGARPFPCARCGARFARALSLRAHAAAHAPPARACQHCGKKFRSQSNLTNHVRFHIGDRRYKCKICGKGFLHRGTLNEHVRGVHHNVRRVRKRVATEGGGRGVTEADVRGVTELEMRGVAET